MQHFESLKAYDNFNVTVLKINGNYFHFIMNFKSFPSTISPDFVTAIRGLLWMKISIVNLGFNSFSAETVFMRQNLTSVDVRF